MSSIREVKSHPGCKLLVCFYWNELYVFNSCMLNLQSLTHTLYIQILIKYTWYTCWTLHICLYTQKKYKQQQLLMVIQHKITKRSELNLIQKHPSCKKKCAALKKAIVKKMWNPRWQPRNGCDGRLIAKIFIMIIQVNLVPNLSEM